ncbi:transposase [Brevibacterium otitidis]|uniref:Transposase n=1 Tax=Brevibacterium otitidis TaxID=53364 RepID=A0ABV5WZ93_9MICO|nr:hypothetical protein GCM10023233_02010 [Brevibacterium otitidis]
MLHDPIPATSLIDDLHSRRSRSSRNPTHERIHTPILVTHHDRARLADQHKQTKSSENPANLCKSGDLLTAKQQERIVDLFADANFTAVEVTWAVYQDIVRAYRTNDGNEGKKLLQTVIDDLTTNLPTGLAELKRLGQTLKRRAADILAFFTRPGTSNGPTEAINGRLEHLRGSALGFRNLTHYIARSLLESGGFRPVLHSQLR